MAPMSPETGKTLRWLMVLVAILVVALLVIKTMESWANSGVNVASQSLDRVLSSITGSHTVIHAGRAEITDTVAISELALMEMKMNAVHEMENTTMMMKYVPLGTKRVMVRGHFRVKAGYRLVPGVSLRMEGTELVANFPKAEILSVELIDIEELYSDNGWANKITGEDRAWLLMQLKEKMEEDAQQSGILNTVDSTLRMRLKDLTGVPNVRVEGVKESP